MEKFDPQTFTGLLIPQQPIGSSDYIHGDPANPLGNLGLRVIVPDGKWDSYVCFPQPQSKPGVYDTNDCTGFGYCRKIATIFNAMWSLGMLPADFIAWSKTKNYIQSLNGTQSFMFDPQVLGIMAGTTSGGNWLQVVAEAARKNGLLPAGTLPGVQAYSNANDYYATSITQDIKDLGLTFLSKLNPGDPEHALPYQWIGTLDEATALKACPLYVALCTCNGWNMPPVNSCNQGAATNHCVVEIEHQEILDSYPPYIKQLSADYPIPYKMMILVNPQTIGATVLKFTKDANSDTCYLEGEKGKLGLADPASLELIASLTNDQPEVSNPAVPQVGIIEQGFNIHK